MELQLTVLSAFLETAIAHGFEDERERRRARAMNPIGASTKGDSTRSMRSAFRAVSFPPSGTIESATTAVLSFN
jgi:hypothetical protein